MESIFDNQQRERIIERVKSLQESDKAFWGKMNAFQMLKHCTLCEDIMQGKMKIKRVFIGRILGKSILKKALQPDRPFGKNSPTSPLLNTLSDTGDFDQQREQWIERIQKYSSFDNDHFVHPFFGKMTPEQIGVFVYKHTDHHLRQFGA